MENILLYGNPVPSSLCSLIKRRDTMIGYIYITTNLINNKKYIGLKTSSVFVPNYFGSGKIIKKALNKYGKNNFSVEILEKCETIQEMQEAERKWIQYYNAQHSDEFYNIAEGGQWGNCIDGMSEEELASYKSKLSETIKDSYNKHPYLREMRANQRRSMKGKIKLSQETIEKRSEHLKKRWEEDYDGMCKIVQKTIKENKEKGTYKATWEKHQHPWIGRKHTEETKKKISEHTNNNGVNNPNRKSGRIFNKDEIVFKFELTQQAHDYLEKQGFKRRELYRMLKGEEIRSYRIQREGQTTIENTNK